MANHKKEYADIKKVRCVSLSDNEIEKKANELYDLIMLKIQKKEMVKKSELSGVAQCLFSGKSGIYTLIEKLNE